MYPLSVLMSHRYLAPFLLLVLAGCVSVRTVDVLPTPGAVANFVAATLGDAPAERIATIPGDSLLTVWHASDPRRLTRTFRHSAGRSFRDLDRVETFEAGGALVDVFVYSTPSEARRSVRRLASVFGAEPLGGFAGPVRTSYFVDGAFMVRVIAAPHQSDAVHALHGGLGRPRIDRYSDRPAFSRMYETLGNNDSYYGGSYGDGGFRRAEWRENAQRVKAIIDARESSNVDNSQGGQ